MNTLHKFPYGKCALFILAREILKSASITKSHDRTTEPFQEAGASAPIDRLNPAAESFYRIFTLNSALLQRPFYVEQIDQSADKNTHNNEYILIFRTHTL